MEVGLCKYAAQVQSHLFAESLPPKSSNLPPLCKRISAATSRLVHRVEQFTHFKCALQQRSRLDRAEAKICKVQPASEQLPKFEMNQEKGKGERRGEREREEEEEEGRGGERENEDFFSSLPPGGRERKCQVSLGVFFCIEAQPQRDSSPPRTTAIILVSVALSTRLHEQAKLLENSP